MPPGSDYDGHMTYFETPNHAAAYYEGMTVEAFEAREDAIVADLEELELLGQPHLDVEDRDLIPEQYVSEVSEQDRADLAWVLDMEAFEGFHA